MRRSFIVFLISQGELNNGRFFQPKMKLGTDLLAHIDCVLLVVRDTKHVYCPKQFEYRESAEPGIYQVDFEDMQEVTTIVNAVQAIKMPIDRTAQIEEIRYFVRTPAQDTDSSLVTFIEA